MRLLTKSQLARMIGPIRMSLWLSDRPFLKVEITKAEQPFVKQLLRRIRSDNRPIAIGLWMSNGTRDLYPDGMFPKKVKLWLHKITARALVRSMVDSLEEVERRFEPRRVKLWLRGSR